jgi:hypothetical protein
MTENSRLEELKKWAEWGAKQNWLASLMAMVILPILECIAINLLTGSSGAAAYMLGAVLTVIAAFHLLLAWFLLAGERTYPVKNAIDALELEEQLQQLRLELDRRSETYRMFRSVIEALNLQTCNPNITDPCAFFRGVDSIVHHVCCNIRSILGVTSNQFTIELYSNHGTVLHLNDPQPCGRPHMDYFFSPQNMDPCTSLNLENRGPHHYGLGRTQPGICFIRDDPQLYYENGKPAPDLYFRSIVTVPLSEACNSDSIVGALVLTSMQTEKFADDVLDTLKFVATIISQYIASHNRCTSEYLEARRRHGGTHLLPSSATNSTTTTPNN